MRRLLVPLLTALALTAVAAVPALADFVTVSNIANLQAAIDGASGARTIELAAGTYVLGASILVNKPSITIQGQGVLATTVQVSGTGYPFQVTGAGCTISNLDFVKTDKTGEQNIVWINALNVSVLNNRFHGQFVIGDGEVARAMLISPGVSGLTISGNTVYALRQPAYFSGALAPSPLGTISSNYVYATKGWVVEGGTWNFTGNTWGTGLAANVVDIALIPTVQAGLYPDIVALGNANTGAVVEDQRPTPRVLNIVAVNAAAAPGGDGLALTPYQSIGSALARVVAGGTVHVAAGTYSAPGGINAAVSLLGPNAATCGHDAARAPEAIIADGGPAIRVGTTAPVVIKGFKFDGPNTAVDSYASGTNITLQNDIFVNIPSTAFAIVAPPEQLNYDCNYFANVNGGEGSQVAGNWNGTTGSRLSITNSVFENTLTTAMNLSAVNATITGNRFTNVPYYGVLLANNCGGTTVSGNTFNGIVNPDSNASGTYGAGVRFYTPSNTLPVTISGNHFLNSFAGVAVRVGSDITTQTITVTGNDFAGNLYAVRNLGTGTVAVPCNWYGSVLGPLVVPSNPSPGDKIEGPVTSFAPWLNGAIPAGVCGGYGSNNIAANTTGLCISNAHPCVTVPVLFNRSDVTGARGVSVTLTLSPNLQLCDMTPLSTRSSTTAAGRTPSTRRSSGCRAA